MGRNTYETKSRPAVKAALLRLLARKPLAEVTISELAREAGISRSTFYDHFGNVSDVYDALVDDLSEDMSPLMSQVMCADGFRSQRRPFCQLVRDAGEYAPVVGEGRFADVMLARDQAAEGRDLYALLVGAGYAPDEARAICTFQMSGCFAAARGTQGDAGDWTRVRAVIDRFILGGIAACLAAKRE